MTPIDRAEMVPFRRGGGGVVVEWGRLRRPRPVPLERNAPSTPGRRKRPHPTLHHPRPYETQMLPPRVLPFKGESYHRPAARLLQEHHSS